MLANIDKNLATIALNNDMDLLDQIQASVDELDKKVENQEKLSTDECDFLVALFLSPWWGGLQHGMNETKVDHDLKPVFDQRQLINAVFAKHYISGNGQTFAAQMPLYQSASIVKDAITELKKFICTGFSNNRSANVVKTTDNGFRNAGHLDAIFNKRSKENSSGFVFNDGTFALDQVDPWISNHNHRFSIHASTTKMGTKLISRWHIEGCFGFDIQGIADSYSTLPITMEKRLTIPNRLSHQLSVQGRAHKFSYFTDLNERYDLAPPQVTQKQLFPGF